MSEARRFYLDAARAEIRWYVQRMTRLTAHRPPLTAHGRRSRPHG